MQPVQDLTVEDRASRTQFQYTLEDAQVSELNAYSPKLLAKLQELPELRDVASDQQDRGLRAKLIYDRDTASRLGITPAMVDQTLYDSYGQRQVSTMFTQVNQYRVILELKPGFQQLPLDLRDLYLRSGAAPQSSASGTVSGGSIAAAPSSRGPASVPPVPTGAPGAPSAANSSAPFTAAPIPSSTAYPNGSQVPLRAFSNVENTTAPIAINRQGQFPVVTLSFNLAPGVSLGDAVKVVQRTRDSIGMPASIQANFQGTAEAFLASLANEPYLILAALVAVYIVLGVLYESYIHPITILSTLPSAGVGALLALYIRHSEFSVVALIGIVLLIGIVKKNAIMMIDFALEAERKEGMSPVDAIYQASLLRFRPIMMTTMAALLGGVPLALGTGTGSELRRPLGITIVGGLLLSQLLTLYTTPVIYLWFDRLSKRFSIQKEDQSRAGEFVPAK
jgi:multidrug efflux pump